MKLRILMLIAVALILGFGYYAVSQALKVKKEQKIESINIESKELNINKLELNLRELNAELKSQLKKKDLDKQKIKELKNKIDEAEQRERQLESELQAKRQKQREDKERASRIAQNALNTVTRTQTVQAAPTTSNCTQLRGRLASLGVSGSNLDSAITLAMRESSCNSAAVNASSGACGEFQSYPCGKWGTPGTDQYLRNAIKYARDRYGSYNGALSHSLANNWY